MRLFSAQRPRYCSGTAQGAGMIDLVRLDIVLDIEGPYAAVRDRLPYAREPCGATI